MKSKRITKTLKVSPASSLLHLVGRCGVSPEVPKGYVLERVRAKGDRLTFVYVRARG